MAFFFDRILTRVLASAVLTVSAPFALANTANEKIWDNASGWLSDARCEAVEQNVPLTDRMRDISQSVIEIVDIDPRIELGPSSHSFKGSFLQAVRNTTASGSANSDEIMVRNCLVGESVKTFVFFDVYVPMQFDPIVRVGVNIEDSDLFRSIRVHTPEEAERLISERAQSSTPPGTNGIEAPQDQVARISALSSSDLTAGVQAVEGPLEYVVCVSSSNLNVRNESLDKVLFTVKRHESVKPVQSFGTDRVAKVISGKTYYFIKVQFPELGSSNNIGWVADEYVRLKTECGNYPQTTPVPTPSPTPDAVPIAGSYTFPVKYRPSDSYKTGQRRFMASRSGGTRYHAACDLYRTQGEDAVAVTAGTVIRDRYYFYEGTYAIEVKHTDGRVVRYGEITGKAATGVGLNKSLKIGQTLGYVGKVNSGCCTPMLHFEMYSGTKSGALTQSGNKFNRRSDLIDPTSYLSTWEKAKFGTSY